MTATVDVAAVDLAAPVRELVGGLAGWRLQARDPWWLVLPPGHRQREQGWKLHLSATVVDAAAVLRAAATVLTTDPCAFKFAATLRTVRHIDGRGCDRASAGKFITAYPDDDDHFRRLAERLHTATTGLTGPVILSDRPYRPGSLVHYRFGGFHNRTVLDNDGMYRQVLTAPDGSLVEDRREARFAPPAWATSPLPAPAGGPTRPATPDGAATGSGRRAVLLGGRFLVREAIRHSAKGGVFLAEDTAEDTAGQGAEHTVDGAGDPAGSRPAPGAGRAPDTVVKQARPHTECDSSGRDSRDLLRNEAGMLDRLAPLGLAPARITTFEQDGQLFLAERRVPGEPLRLWVDARASGRPGLSRDDAVAMARRLVDLVDSVHRAGVVVRDLSPTNVVVGSDGRPVLVDLELAAPVGALARRGGTPGYQSPEQRAPEQRAPAQSGGSAEPEHAEPEHAEPEHAEPERTVATVEEDLYSLGALLFLLVTGNDPMLPEDAPPVRPAGARLAGWLDLLAGQAPAARVLGPAVRGLLRDDPTRRWSIDQVRRSLRADPAATAAGPAPTRAADGPAPGSPPAGPDRLLADGLGYLLDTMTPDDPTRLWPARGTGAQTDPLNVQHGAAGVLAVLTRAARIAAPGLPDTMAAVRTAAGWVARAAGAAGSPLPGLYFGRAGTAWALHDAAVLLADPELAGAAVDLALRLPAEWPNPDITHGMAGAGLAHLHLAAGTGDVRLAERAERYAAAVAERVARNGADVTWPVPASFDSRLAGVVHYGFAHGVAGIGWFLLASARASGDPERLVLAREAGLTLCRAARYHDGAAWWPASPGGPGRFTHWCSGSSGIGTFLLRLYRDTGEQRFAELAGAAARAVHRSRFGSLPSACHGLAGDGEFLLDAGQVLGGRYRRWAGDLADLLSARHALVRGRALVPDETGQAVAADYNTGLAGAVAFLLRLRHGGERLWMADR